MNAAPTFDTHRFVKSLVAVGFTEPQAETLAKEQVSLLESNLATKADLAMVRSDLATVRSDLATVKSDLEVQLQQVKSELEVRMQQNRSELEVRMQQNKSELEVRMQQNKSELLKWMIGAMIAQTALIVGLILGLAPLL